MWYSFSWLDCSFIFFWELKLSKGCSLSSFHYFLSDSEDSLSTNWLILSWKKGDRKSIWRNISNRDQIEIDVSNKKSEKNLDVWKLLDLKKMLNSLTISIPSTKNNLVSMLVTSLKTGTLRRWTKEMKWNLEEYKQETRKLILSIHWRKVLKHFPNPQQISKISVEPLNFGNWFCYQVPGLDGVKGRDTFAKIKTTCQNMIYGETFQIGFNKKSIGS